MEKTELNCRLCRYVVTEGNLSTESNIREVLELLLSSIKFEEDSEQVVCKTCSSKLNAAYSFKQTCMKTEDCIFPYTGSRLLDMKEIFLLINGHDPVNISEHENVCRLCLHLLACEFIPLTEIDFGLISEYIPGVNFSATKEPVICQMCFKSLIIHSTFLRSCLYTDEGLRYTSDDKASIKTEEIDIKPEDDTDSDTDDASVEKAEGVKLDPPTAGQTFKCETCSFQTKYKNSLRFHNLRHKHASELQMQKCSKCGYQTKRRRYLLNHLLRHKDPSELKRYRCGYCTFETRYKSYLATHQLMHKNPAEVHMYKCNKCTYETYLKYQIAAHQLCHKDSSEVRMYKCDKCSYETKWKYNLAHHKSRHKDTSEAQIFKCDDCDFQTDKKYSFQHHRKSHRDPSKMYTCAVCGYVSKYQRWFMKHQAMHEAEMQGTE